MFRHIKSRSCKVPTMVPATIYPIFNCKTHIQRLKLFRHNTNIVRATTTSTNWIWIKLIIKKTFSDRLSDKYKCFVSCDFLYFADEKRTNEWICAFKNYFVKILGRICYKTRYRSKLYPFFRLAWVKFL